MHNPVEALAIIVDDPPGIAQAMLPAFLQAFIDIAFVKLRVAHQRHHAAGRALAGSEIRPRTGNQIILDD